MEEWKEYKLEDTSIEMIDGDRGKNYPKNNDFLSDGYCLFLNAGNVTKDGFSFSDKSFITQEKDDELRKGRLEKYDVVITTRGTVGNVALYDNKVPFEHIRINSGMLILKSGKDILSEYLYYYLKGKKFQSQISLFVSGSAQPQLPKSTLGKMSISYPNNKDTQNKIVSILKSLDDKIEVNRKINENLEQQAQALFKSWFVDFEPFKNGEFVESELGMIPKGWRVGTLGEVLNLRKDSYKKGSDLTLPYMPIDIIPMHSLGVNEFKDNKEAQSSLQTFEKNDIIIGAMRVYFHRVVIAPCKGITRNTCFVLKPKNNIMWAYCILECNQDEAINYANRTSKGSTMPYAVWENGFADYSIVIPPDSVLEMFNLLVSPILEKIRDSYKESRRLAEIRDTLLPKLMSGELKVNNIH